MSDCEQCGECCESMEFPVVADADGYYQWIVIHGGEVVFKHGLLLARLPLPCSRLEDGKCGIYDSRPQMCRDYECERDDR
jgi:Fe-S-cluster containining protein